VAQKRAAEQQVAIVNNKARADVAAANAGVTQARAGLSSARANTAQRPAYEQSLQALRAAVRAARADLRANEVRLRATSLRSPLTGVVTQRNLDPGSLVSPAQTVLTVQDARQVWLTVGVPEEVRRRVFSGQSAQVTFDGLPGQTFAGRVLRINPAADPQSRQFTLRVRLDNRTGEIRPGMFGRVTLVTERARQALVVPKEAVKRDRKTQDATVTVVTSDNKAENRPVQTGLGDAKMVVVKSGLREGEKVIILSGRDLKDGQPVRVAALTPVPSPGAAGEGGPSNGAGALSRTGQSEPADAGSPPLSRSAGRGDGGEGRR
jgi:RND family efflux transporter MFP subunit